MPMTYGEACAQAERLAMEIRTMQKRLPDAHAALASARARIEEALMVEDPPVVFEEPPVDVFPSPDPSAFGARAIAPLPQMNGGEPPLESFDSEPEYRPGGFA